MKCTKLKEEDSLYQEIESQIDRIKFKKNKYVWTYRTIKVLVFIAGAVITVLTGWKMNAGCEFNPDNLILIISTMITLFAAFEGLFDLKDKAMNYDILLYELRRLRSKMCFDYSKDPDLFASNKDDYFSQNQAILQSQKSIIENSYDKEG